MAELLSVLLLSQYSGYHKEHIRKIVKSAFAEKGAQNELISEKQAIKIKRAVELLSEYSGYNKFHIWKILRVANATKGAQNELISEKQPIKIEFAKTVQPWEGKRG